MNTRRLATYSLHFDCFQQFLAIENFLPISAIQHFEHNFTNLRRVVEEQIGEALRLPEFRLANGLWWVAPTSADGGCAAV